jgi:hypothetical protein
MGDRSNVTLVFDSDPNKVVDIYSHWSGKDLFETVREAIAEGERWDDDRYLARIITSRVLATASDPSLGFGISPESTHDACSYPSLVVDLAANRVAFRDSDDTSPIGKHEGESFFGFGDNSSRFGYDAQGNSVDTEDSYWGAK